MNKEILKGDWNIVKGKVKEKWGKLTDDDLTAINGKKEILLGTLQKKYGLAKEKAEQELNEWEKSCCDNNFCSEERHHHHDEEHHHTGNKTR